MHSVFYNTECSALFGEWRHRSDQTEGSLFLTLGGRSQDKQVNEIIHTYKDEFYKENQVFITDREKLLDRWSRTAHLTRGHLS